MKFNLKLVALLLVMLMVLTSCESALAPLLEYLPEGWVPTTTTTTEPTTSSTSTTKKQEEEKFDRGANSPLYRGVKPTKIVKNIP